MDGISPFGTRAAQSRAAPQMPANGPLRDAAAQFAGLVWQEAFRPLGRALGFYGDLVVSAAGLALARGESGGLADELVRALSGGQAP